MSEVPDNNSLTTATGLSDQILVRRPTSREDVSRKGAELAKKLMRNSNSASLHFHNRFNNMKFRSIALPRSTLAVLLLCCFAATGATMGAAQEQASLSLAKKPSEPTSDAVRYQRLVDRSVEYLRQRGQADDGSFSSAVGIGPTGVVVSG